MCNTLEKALWYIPGFSPVDLSNPPHENLRQQGTGERIHIQNQMWVFILLGHQVAATDTVDFLPSVLLSVKGE